MVIRPAHEGTARPGRAIPGIDPARLGPAERDQLLQEIEIRGAGLVAEEKVGFGTTPSLTSGGPGAEALCRAPVRGRHRQRLHRRCRAAWP